MGEIAKSTHEALNKFSGDSRLVGLKVVNLEQARDVERCLITLNSQLHLHRLVAEHNENVDSGRYLRILLDFGLDPDYRDGDGNTAVHLAARFKKQEFLADLLLCRPNLGSLNKEGQTPADCAWLDDDGSSSVKNHDDDCVGSMIRMMLKEDRDGPLTLMALLYEGLCFAARNILRRGKVSYEESVTKYLGKTAMDWVVVNGEQDISDELIFYLSRLEARENHMRNERGRRLASINFDGQLIMWKEKTREDFSELASMLKDKVQELQITIQALERKIQRINP